MRIRFFLPYCGNGRRATRPRTRCESVPETPHCYHDRRDETADSWPGIGRGAPRGGPHGGPAPGEPGNRSGSRQVQALPGATEDTRIRGRQAGAATARVGGGVARGLGGFIRPFRRVGGILFLEVAGGFFLLFVLVFGLAAWRMRSDYAHGPDHAKFLVSAGMGLVFLYLGAELVLAGQPAVTQHCAAGARNAPDAMHPARSQPGPDRRASTDRGAHASSSRARWLQRPPPAALFREMNSFVLPLPP